MVKVLLPRRRRSGGTHRGISWCTGIALLVLATTLGQAQAPSSKTRSAGSRDQDQAQPKGGAEPAQPKAADADAEPAANVPGADPSQTRRVAPNEVFKDPRALQVLDMGHLQTIRKPSVTQAEIAAVGQMAANVNATLDRGAVERFADAMVAKLTDRENIQALIDPPAGVKPEKVRAVQEATTNLLAPLFGARASKNTQFLTAYNRILIQKLTPLLKNHLIPRVQAMIVLGECGSADAFPIYEREIKDRTQTLWVKLWALEGISNLKGNNERLSASAESNAAKVIADFLEAESDLPWPVQLRALEALGALRQGFLPAAPRRADMASTAMKLLVDPQARLEVRAEAARALGMMQITTQVPRYNFALVAHAIGQLAAELGEAVGSKFPSNEIKARYLTSLLIGPVFQAFDGVQGATSSGLLHNAAGNAGPFVNQVFELIKPIAQTSVQLMGAPSRDYNDLKKNLSSHVRALKAFLDQNAPQDRKLVQGGPDFPAAQAGGGPKAPAVPLAGARRGP